MENKPTLLDRAIGVFSPRAQAKRIAYRALMGSKAFERGLKTLNKGGAYRGNRHGATLGSWKTTGDDANAEIKYTLDDLRNDSNDLVLNNALARGAVDTLCTNIIGTGLQLAPSIDWEFLGLDETEADEFQEAASREFELFSKTCDLTRTRTLTEIGNLVARSMFVNGDLLVNLPMVPRKGIVYETSLDLIEGHRLSTPAHMYDSDDLFMGIKLDKDGAPEFYHYLADQAKRVWRQLAAFDSNGFPLVLHIFRKQRINQNRGIPILAPIIEIIKKLDTYAQAEVDAAVINAFFTVFIKKKTTGEGDDPIDVIANGESSESDSRGDDELALESGNIIELLDDEEEVQFADPNRPNANFPAFFDKMVTILATGINLPKEVLMKEFQASYSASKGAIIEATKYFDEIEAFLIDAFYQPVYETILLEAIAKGRLSAPGFMTDPLIRQAYCGSVWIGPAQNELDPSKGAKAAQQRIDTGTSNEIIESARQGRTFKQTAKGAATVRRIREKFKIPDPHAEPEPEPTKPE